MSASVKLPHFKVGEKAIFQRWLNQAFITGEHQPDFHIHTMPEKVPAGEDERGWRVWRSLRAIRIDDVIETDTEIWLIEVDPRLFYKKLVGLVGYRDAYKDHEKPEKPIRLGYVCEHDDPTMHRYLKMYDIKLWVV